ncbi:MAG TPA: geranylgeranylglycerol-phosphate geranylgeranyltransferase [Candidatus Dormibacteraeota bacterium]|jgi:geranylgeranylglycerol-phosphate geranylgeranyltransferase|nr:geranylgeranylglycerol-phosphate geranylgeranyltransferase [Candidatus Dormibacteraeota bacterium]
MANKGYRKIYLGEQALFRLILKHRFVESTSSSRIETETFTTSLASHLGAYVTLVRVPNCLMIGLAVVVGETIALGIFPSLPQAVLGFLTASLLLAGTMVLNDIQDVQIDKVNSPDRPIPSGKVSIREAYAASMILSGLALLSSAFLGILPLLTAVVALALMAYYNTRGKKTGLLGNAVVSFNVALPFLFGGFAVDHPIRPLLFIFFLLAFLANLAREIAKGISDIEGDSAKRVRTIAVTLGPKRAGLIAGALFVVAAALSFTTPLVDKISWFYYPGVVAADLGFLYSSYRLVLDQTAKTVRVVKTQVLLWMLLGLVGFLMGGSSIL